MTGGAAGHTNCTQVLSAHVVYDRERKGYKVQVRCACGLTSRIAKTLHRGFDGARDEARTIPLRITAAPAKPKRIRDRRKKRPVEPVAPPTPAEIRAAWVAYWKGICARVGHESRL